MSNKLNDLYICKRIAEIEGYKPILFMGMVKTNDNHNYEPTGKSTRNKALLSDLIVKYGVNVEFVGAGVECLASFPVKNIENTVFNSKLSRAVCLAIIKTESEINKGDKQ